jgi:hypothetical protein
MKAITATFLLNNVLSTFGKKTRFSLEEFEAIRRAAQFVGDTEKTEDIWLSEVVNETSKFTAKFTVRSFKSYHFLFTRSNKCLYVKPVWITVLSDGEAVSKERKEI